MPEANHPAWASSKTRNPGVDGLEIPLRAELHDDDEVPRAKHLWPKSQKITYFLYALTLLQI